MWPFIPAFNAFFLILFKCIGGHGHNGDRRLLFIRERTNPPSCFITVHLRHLDIHQDQVIPAGRSRFDLFNGNLSVSRSIHLKARFFKKRRCDLQIQFVILDYQKLLSSKIRSFLKRVSSAPLLPRRRGIAEKW